jgi:hypothetical protein
MLLDLFRLVFSKYQKKNYCYIIKNKEKMIKIILIDDVTILLFSKFYLFI